MVDPQEVAQWKRELQLLQSNQGGLAASHRLLQTVSSQKAAVLPDNQYTNICRTFSFIPKSVPIIQPTINGVDELLMLVANASVVLKSRIESLSSAIKQAEQEVTDPQLATNPQTQTRKAQEETTRGSPAQPKTGEGPSRPKTLIPRPLKLAPIWAISGAIAATLVVLLGTLFDEYATKRPSVTYDAQIKSLDKTKESIQSLLGFIDEQKRQLQVSQNAVDALKTEEGRIHPLVEADRRVIDALFAGQEQRNQAQQSKERWIGVFLGIFASLIATLLYSLVSKFLQRRRQNTEA